MLTYALVSLAVLVVALAVLAVVVARQPNTFRVSRSATIAAPPADVFAQVNDLRAWHDWSPWAKTDPACQNTFEGPPAGVGAVHGWSGNGKVGQGRMTITDSRPDELVRLKLEFMRPFRATNTAEFTFQPEGRQTRVTWSMVGQKNFVCKAMCMVAMDMDKMCGGEFEKGLAQIKAITESAAANRHAGELVTA